MSAEIRTARLADICSDVSYGYTASAETEPVGPKFLRITDIQGGVVDWDHVPYCPIVEKNVDKYLLEAGDIVVARTGNSTGENYAYNGNYEAVFASYLIRFRINPKMANPFFVWYQMRTARWWNFISGAKGGSAQAGANAKVLGTYDVFLPPVEEQNQIVKQLQCIDDKIELTRQINQTLEQMAQAIFKSWFVDFDPVHAKVLAIKEGRDPIEAAARVIGNPALDQVGASLREIAELFPSEFVESELGLIPKGWGISSIADFCEVIDCLHSKKPTEILEDTGNILLQLNNIRDDGLLDLEKKFFISDEDYTKWISRIEVKEDDCVITNVGRVGAVSIIPRGTAAAIGRNITAIRLKEGKNLRAFLLVLLTSPWMTLEIERRTDFGTILNALNVKSIPRLRLLDAGRLLSLFDQECYPMVKKRQDLLEESSKLGKIRDTLLPKLLSGEIRVDEAEQHVWSLQ